MSGSVVYAWRTGLGGRMPVSAQAAGEEIARITSADDPYFRAREVVSASRPADAPLHPVFEWDDAVAAEAHRVEQARSLIRSVVACSTSRPDAEPVRAFVSVSPDNDGPRYTTMHYAMADPDLRAQILAQALSELRAFERKYAALLDLSKVMAAFDAAYREALDEDGEQV